MRRETAVPGEGSVTIGRVPPGARLLVGGTDLPVAGEQVVVRVPDGPTVDLVLLP